MIKLNDDLLRELGLDALPLEEKKRMLAHIYETLEMRVGMKLAQQMTDQQLDEFEQFIKSNDEAGALHWLETKFPHYKDVVSAEFENLKAEIRQVAPQILASAQQAAAMQSQVPPQMQPAMGQPQMPQQQAFGQPAPQSFQAPAPQPQAGWPQHQQPQPQQWPAAVPAPQPFAGAQPAYPGYGQIQQPFSGAPTPSHSQQPAPSPQTVSPVPAPAGQPSYGGPVAPVATQPSPQSALHQPATDNGAAPANPWSDPAQSQQPPLAA